MVKLLIIGSVQGNWSLLHKKLSSLQNSSHGPFDLLLCTGTFFLSSEEFSAVAPSLSLPLPTYVLDRTGIPTEESQLPQNLHLLPLIGNIMIGKLSVACMASHMEKYASSAYERLVKSPEEVMYFKGYDVLLTSDWPMGVSGGMASELALPAGEDAVSQLACHISPRYHFSCGEGEVFYQRTPYINCDNTNSQTRFIGMASVSASKEKTKKWIHALSLDPVATHPATSSNVAVSSCTPCPYAQLRSASTVFNPPPPPPLPSSAAGNKRKLEDAIGQQPPLPGAFSIYGPASEHTKRQNLTKNVVPPNDKATTLFVGGLSHNIREKDIEKTLSDVVDVKIPQGKNYAFVEFATHQAAQAVVKESQTTIGVSIKGRPVSIGWAAGRQESGGNRGYMQNLMHSPPSSNSNTLFIGGLPEWSPDDVASEGSMSKSQVEASLLGLFPGSTTVHMLDGKSYAFVDFKSHEMASEIVEKYTADNETFALPNASDIGILTVGWAQGKSQDRGMRKEYDNSASHDADCWFCLASTSVKIHLIVAVGEAVYVSLPRGGVADWHVLLVPIDCVPTRAQLSPLAARELITYQDTIERMFASQGLACLRFERALRTQGQRNHMQVHVVPLTAQHVKNAIPIFLDLTNEFKVHFHEILDSRLSIEEFIVNLPGGPYLEYFCVEIPCGEVDSRMYRRFVFVQPGDGPRVRFPMHFGTELSARVIEKPERANWKNCVQSEDEESKLAESFRNSFKEFDVAP